MVIPHQPYYHQALHFDDIQGHTSIYFIWAKNNEFAFLMSLKTWDLELNPHGSKPATTLSIWNPIQREVTLSNDPDI